MHARTTSALAAAFAAVLVTTTSALAGSGVGGVFNLGQINTVDQKSTLSGSTSEANLSIQNTGTGTALNLVGGAGAAPFKVNSDTKVASLNADKLDGLDSTSLQRRVTGTCGAGQALKVINADGSVSCEPVSAAGAWGLKGNSGTSPGTNFLGTTDNRALELKVNGQGALRLEPNATSPGVVGGFAGNEVVTGAEGATIAGGGASGLLNVVSDDFGTVGGGDQNVAGDLDGAVDPSSATFATVAGGETNAASRFASTVGGGIRNTAGGTRSTIAGGAFNATTGLDATVPGGSNNSADGAFSFAAGRQAKAANDGSFVWADGQNADMSSSTANQFVARAGGHFFLQSDSTLDDQSGFINTSTGAFLSIGGTWTNASSRSLKAGFATISPVRILEKVVALPLTSWHYKTQPKVRHIGPVSEDFYRAFRVGDNSRSIGTVDEGGVALAAIQGLYRQNQALRSQLKAQDARLSRLERAFAARSR